MVTIELSKEKIRESIIVIAAGFLVVFMLLDQKWALWISLGVLLTGAFSDTLARWIHIGWMKLAQGMGYVMSRILLSSIFYLFLTPIALLYRLLGKKGLSRDAKTYYYTRNHAYSGKDLKNVW